MRYLEVLRWSFWNAMACIFWVLLILEDHRRIPFLLVLLPLQLIVNLALYAVLKRFRIPGLTFVYVLGMLWCLIQVATDRQWWMLALLPIPAALAVWSVRGHHARLSRKENG